MECQKRSIYRRYTTESDQVHLLKLYTQEENFYNLIKNFERHLKLGLKCQYISIYRNWLGQFRQYIDDIRIYIKSVAIQHLGLTNEYLVTLKMPREGLRCGQKFKKDAVLQRLNFIFIFQQETCMIERQKDNKFCIFYKYARKYIESFCDQPFQCNMLVTPLLQGDRTQFRLICD